MKKQFTVIAIVVLACAATLGIVKGCRHVASRPASDYQGIPYNHLDLPGNLGKPDPKAIKNYKAARGKLSIAPLKIKSMLSADRIRQLPDVALAQIKRDTLNELQLSTTDSVAHRRELVARLNSVNAEIDRRQAAHSTVKR